MRVAIPVIPWLYSSGLRHPFRQPSSTTRRSLMVSAQNPEINPSVVDESPSSSGVVKSDFVSKTGTDVSSDVISHAAALARIEVTAEENMSLVPRIQDFLRFVDAIKDLDDHGPSEQQAGDESQTSFLRDDNVKTFQPVSSIMNNMPKTKDKFLVVPRIEEHDDENPGS